MNSSGLDSLLEKLPYLRHLMGTHGDMSLFDYGRAHYRWIQGTDRFSLERKTEFINILGWYVLWKFGPDMAQKVTESLEKNYAISTAEHHGPMWHPFFFQSTLLRGLVNPDETIVNLCTSHVSLGNSSYPRGLVFHGDGVKAPAEYLHIPFFPAGKRMSPVFGLWRYTRENLWKSALPKIHTYQKERMITEETYNIIVDFLENIALDEWILNAGNYSEQITLINHRWWREMFPGFPEYIPLDAEDIVREILTRHIEKNTLIGQLVTDEKIQPMIEEYFDGISCCFERKNRKWTYLFWYLDKENSRHALWRQGNSLVTSDGIFHMKMDSSSLTSALWSGTLIPSGLLVYATLSCYYGLTCFGWVFQDTYLTAIKLAFEKIFSNYEEWFSNKTDIINADLYFLFTKKHQPISAIDFILNNLEWNLFESSKNILLNQAIENCIIDL